MPSPLASVIDRLDNLNRKVDRLCQTTGAQNSHANPSLLVGWAEISAFARKDRITLQRYRRLMAFPACRFGRHVVSTPALIEAWLLTTEQRRRQRKAAEAAS